MSADPLDVAREQGWLSPLDHQLARRLAALYDESRAGVRWALALASRQVTAGHVCADLRRLDADGIELESEGAATSATEFTEHPSVDGWLDQLAESALVEVVSTANAGLRHARPLVLDGRGRLYLRRAFESEGVLVDRLRERSARPDLDGDDEGGEAAIERLCPDDEDAHAREALRRALARPLTIVTGGPGSGKTTLVGRLVALLVERAQTRAEPLPRVRLLAPTGKAAATLSAAFAHQREALDVAPETRAAMDASAETIHRALHRLGRTDALGRTDVRSIDADLVVVDEASMVDLERMSRLFVACRDVARVVLVGDPGQLASVESGAVLADLCGAGAAAERPPAVLRDAVVTLRGSRRFAASGGIGRLAEAIRAGDADGVVALLEDDAVAEVERCEVESIDGVRARLVETVSRSARRVAEADSPAERLARTEAHRVLCAHRRGPLGVDALCPILDETAAQVRHAPRRGGWWPGRILLVTRNAPDQDLWNGDVGLVEETEAGLRAIFPAAAGGVRMLSAGRLPSHESAIAMSVHKSQGSEFDEVDLVLGATSSRLMTRELLYTGVTRARRRLRLHASEAVLREAVARRVVRDSALVARLEEGPV